MKNLRLAFKFGSKFPVGGSVPVVFISWAMVLWAHISAGGHIRAFAFHLLGPEFDSQLVRNFLNVTQTQSSCEKSKSQRALSKVVGFLRVLRFPPTGKVGRVG